MPPLPVTFVFAAALGLLLVAQALPVVVRRAKLHQPFGDGGDASLERAIRAHGNLAEYAPMFLLLLALAEIAGAQALHLYLLGGLFLFSRAVYLAYFFGWQILPLRIVAFWSSVLPVAGAAILLAIA